MKSVIYISTKAGTFGEDDLAALVENSRKMNAANDITGCLVYNGMNFMQLLEGDAATIDDCMARITADARHSGVVIIRETTRETRECPDWGMEGRTVFQKQDDAQKSHVRDMLKNASEDTRRIFASFSSL